jgi:uncharacterized protein YukE
MDEVYMDIPAVRGMSKNFNNISEVLQNVSRTLQALITVLRTTAFVGNVGGAAVAQFMEMIKPHIDNMSRKTAELSRDLEASVNAFERGDSRGATRFY